MGASKSTNVLMGKDAFEVCCICWKKRDDLQITSYINLLEQQVPGMNTVVCGCVWRVCVPVCHTCNLLGRMPGRPP
jgi:hypothetical protein